MKVARPVWSGGKAERPYLSLREDVSEHHLVPRSQGRRQGVKVQDLPTVSLCPACHKFLHRTFSNAELAGEYHSLDALLAHDAVRRFVAWLRTQPASKGVRVR